jgi:hypothetical protein
MGRRIARTGCSWSIARSDVEEGLVDAIR